MRAAGAIRCAASASAEGSGTGDVAGFHRDPAPVSRNNLTAVPAPVEFRYEELLADPVGELRGIFDWIGLERNDGALETAVRAHAFGANEPTGATEFARAATPGLWRQNLSPAEQRVAEGIMGAGLADLGYAV